MNRVVRSPEMSSGPSIPAFPAKGRRKNEGVWSLRPIVVRTPTERWARILAASQYPRFHLSMTVAAEVVEGLTKLG